MSDRMPPYFANVNIDLYFQVLCQKLCQHNVSRGSLESNLSYFDFLANQISVFAARGCPSLVMWCEPTRSAFDGQIGPLGVKLVKAGHVLHLIHLAGCIRLSNRSEYIVLERHFT